MIINEIFKDLWPLLSSKFQQCVDGRGTIEQYKFLEKEVSGPCLAALLGVGKGRLRKSTGLSPDLRFGSARKGSHEQTYSVDSFLTTMYQQVAETLPDRPVQVVTLKARSVCSLVLTGLSAGARLLSWGLTLKSLRLPLMSLTPSWLRG